MNALITAILRKDKSAVDRLIKCGADPNEPDPEDPDSRTPLMHAVLNGDLDTLAVLIGHAADVNATDNAGFTGLHFAAQDYQLKAAEALLAAHANVNAQDQYGNPPLWRAVYESRGRGEMIKLLLSHGANANLLNKSGKSPLELAHMIGNHDVKQFLPK